MPSVFFVCGSRSDNGHTDTGAKSFSEFDFLIVGSSTSRIDDKGCLHSRTHCTGMVGSDVETVVDDKMEKRPECKRAFRQISGERGETVSPSPTGVNDAVPHSTYSIG